MENKELWDNIQNIFDKIERRIDQSEMQLKNYMDHTYIRMVKLLSEFNSEFSCSQQVIDLKEAISIIKDQSLDIRTYHSDIIAEIREMEYKLFSKYKSFACRVLESITEFDPEADRYDD